MKSVEFVKIYKDGSSVVFIKSNDDILISLSDFKNFIGIKPCKEDNIMVSINNPRVKSFESGEFSEKYNELISDICHYINCKDEKEDDNCFKFEVKSKYKNHENENIFLVDNDYNIWISCDSVLKIINDISSNVSVIFLNESYINDVHVCKSFFMTKNSKELNEFREWMSFEYSRILDIANRAKNEYSKDVTIEWINKSMYAIAKYCSMFNIGEDDRKDIVNRNIMNKLSMKI